MTGDLCILIPGFMGSYLNAVKIGNSIGGMRTGDIGQLWSASNYLAHHLVPGHAGVKYIRIWYSIYTMDRKWIAWLKKDNTAHMNGFYIEPAGANQEHYGDLINGLRSRFSEVLSWGYDFRIDRMRLAESLATTIRTYQQQGRQVSIIAHSMGGLIAASATHMMTIAERQAIVHFVTLGTPFLGAWSAAQGLEGKGYIIDNVILPMRKQLDLIKWGVRPTDAIADNIFYDDFIELIKEILKTWPSSYQLLPHPSLQTLIGEDAALNRWQALPDTWDSMGWTMAKSFHGATTYPADFIFHRAVRGTGQGAPEVLGANGAIHGIDGDGTVVVQSASKRDAGAGLNYDVALNHFEISTSRVLPTLDAIGE